MEVHEDAHGQIRQYPLEDERHVASRVALVARIDKQEVPRAKLRERRAARRLHGHAQQLDRQSIEAGARPGVDRDDARQEGPVGHGAGHESRRVARADLDDARRTVPSHHGVGRGAVEPRKPVLVPARCRGRLTADGFKPGRQSVDRLEMRGEGRRTSRDHGLSTMPSRASTAPGIAASTSRPTASSQSSSWSGSWWNTTSFFTPADLHRRTPSCQVEWPQPT